MLKKSILCIFLLTIIILSYTLFDIFIISYLIGRGSYDSFYNKFKNDIVNYNFIDANIEFFVFSIYRFTITMGIYLGYLIGGSIGKYVTKIHEFLLVLMIAFPMVKLLAYSERRHMDDVYFWLLLSCTCVASVLLYFLPRCLVVAMRAIRATSSPHAALDSKEGAAANNKKKVVNLMRLLSYAKPDIVYISTAVLFMMVASICLYTRKSI